MIKKLLKLILIIVVIKLVTWLWEQTIFPQLLS